MNPTETTARLTDKDIEYRIQDWEAERNRYALCASIMRRLGPQLSSTVWFSPCVYISVRVTCREDLAVLMTLAPVWTKTPSANGINYNATVEGQSFEIAASDAALPSTCKLVEEEYEVPAVEAKPATKATRMVLKCDHLDATS